MNRRMLKWIPVAAGVLSAGLFLSRTERRQEGQKPSPEPVTAPARSTPAAKKPTRAVQPARKVKRKTAAAVSRRPRLRPDPKRLAPSPGVARDTLTEEELQQYRNKKWMRPVEGSRFLHLKKADAVRDCPRPSHINCPVEEGVPVLGLVIRSGEADKQSWRGMQGNVREGNFPAKTPALYVE